MIENIYKFIIGVDFDNTIISYDDLLYKVAEERGISVPYMVSKKAIRDYIRQTPNGEIEWQRLQAIVYGPRIGEAKLIEGVGDFLKLCKLNKIKVYIISHKSVYAVQDKQDVNLRNAAIQWMAVNHFFGDDGLGLDLNSICFGATRADKIQLIKKLGCTYFIDDLEETFLEQCFPSDILGILYSPSSLHHNLINVKVMTNWREISDYFSPV